MKKPVEKPKKTRQLVVIVRTETDAHILNANLQDGWKFVACNPLPTMHGATLIYILEK